MSPLILATSDSDSERYYLRRAFARAIEEAGGVLAIALPSAAPLATNLIARADGLYLTGGDDIHPSRWGESIAAHYRGTIDTERDALEFALVKAALERKIPIFGICRGMQILNVFFGGSLYQDIAAELPGALSHTRPTNTPRETLVHDVILGENSHIARIIGTTRIATNSSHHQGVRRLAPRLVASAKTSDGLIEAIEDPMYPFLIGVEWHPEELTDTDARWKKLFVAFINATRDAHRTT